MENTERKQNLLKKEEATSTSTKHIFPEFSKVLITESPKMKPEIPREEIPIFKYEGIKMLELLGEGGFGKVFRAYNISLNKFIAIKHFKNPTVKTYNNIRHEDSILNEVEKVNNMNNFLKYEGIFRDEMMTNNYILVMESGEINLKEILRVRKKYELNNVIYIFRSLAHGLLLLEQNGIASRDIKPENVILVEDEKNPKFFQYKVSDFGIGCVLPKSDKTINCNQVSGFSEKYSAPEIMKILKKNYPKSSYNPFISDVYSLAITVIEMIGFKQSEFFKNQKDHVLFSLLSDMLEEYPDDRIDFAGIVEELNKFLPETEQPFDESNYIQEFKRIKEKKLTPIERVENLITNYNGYRDISHYKKAQEILTLCNEIYVKHNQKITGTLSELKICRENAIMCKEFKGNYKEALEWETKYKNLSVFLCGELSEQVADANNLLAASMLKMGVYEKAEKLYIEALKAYEDISGNESANFADILENLGIYYRDFEDSRKKAEKCFVKALNIKKKTLGKNHPDTAKCYLNFANFLCEVKMDFDKAKKLYFKALEINEKKLGSQHFQTAYTFSNLALFYIKSKKFLKGNQFFKEKEKDWALADQYLTKALKIADQVFGNESIEVAKLYENFATYYSYVYSTEDNQIKDEGKGKYKFCLDYLLKSLKIQEKILGVNDIQIGHTNFKIGNYYDNLHLTRKKSKPFYKISLDIYENLLGKDHKLTMKAKHAFLDGNWDKRIFFLLTDNKTTYVMEYYVD